jgi:hypothetical protein
MALFLVIATASFFCELIYYTEIHRFNIYVFGMLGVVCLSGVVRTYVTLRA